MRIFNKSPHFKSAVSSQNVWNVSKKMVHNIWQAAQ